MKDKIGTHRRFIRKAEKDLVQLYKDGESQDFMDRYAGFRRIADPDLRLEEMYYDILDEAEEYQSIIDYALEMMNKGHGDYQLHMIELLRALNNLERYHDVISFADQLMEEDISQGFRVDVANERHKAKLKLEKSTQNVSDSLSLTNVESVDFENMTKEEILQFLGVVTEQSDSRYKNKLVDYLKKTVSPEIVTFILLYLKNIQHDGEVEYHKFEAPVSVIPAKLPDLEDSRLLEEVLPKVIDHLEQDAPEMKEEVKMLLMSHAIYSYPKDNRIKTEDMVNAYLSYIYSLINIEQGIEVSEVAMEWIYELENELGKNN